MSMAIKKWGNSNAIRINQQILNDAGLTLDDKVEIKVNEKQEIVIKKLKDRKMTLKSLFSTYKGDRFESELIDFGDDVGSEIF